MDLFSLLWPDQFDDDIERSLLEESSYLLRCGRLEYAEILLTSSLQRYDSDLQQKYLFLCHIYLQQNRLAQYLECSKLLSSNTPHLDLLHYLEAVYLYKSKQVSLLKPFDDQWWTPCESTSYILILFRLKMMIVAGHLEEALLQLQDLPLFVKDSIEGVIVYSFYLIAIQDLPNAFSIIYSATQRFSGNEELQCLACELAILTRSRELTLPIVRESIQQFPHCQVILRAAVSVQLLQNINADARYTCLKERLLGITNLNLRLNQANILTTFERIGHCDWLKFSKYDYLSHDHPTLELKQNLAMQLSSCESIRVKEHLLDLEDCRFKHLENLNILPLSSDSFTSNHNSSKPRIAWCSSDIAMHPVFRFIYSFFANSSNLECEHYIVDTFNHGAESAASLLDNLSNITYFNLGHADPKSRIDAARSLNADIAIDLSGWTGGHFQDGFMSRIAQFQLNYLGYFASVGTKQMDFWLGDSSLFPDPVTEFHTESILRLDRCFIAWQPADNLIESTLDVVEMSDHSDGIRFGTFNANRKLSDVTLATWGRILDAVSGSRLVLKANNSDDPRTLALLKTRMIQNGLNVDRILWIHRTQESAAHLNQYAQIDIALDPFPNGGCTTTCEALWMGVPTITLTGTSYVSRMSTAVLHGADLSSLCANSIEEYISLALLYAQKLSWLRQNRDYWRFKIINNPLGDAQSLMSALESSFKSIAS